MFWRLLFGFSDFSLGFGLISGILVWVLVLCVLVICGFNILPVFVVLFEFGVLF